MTLTSERRGTLETQFVYGAHLAGNRLGESPKRQVTVYLPPKYHHKADQRWPVLYLLHGFGSSDRRWFEQTAGSVSLDAIADGLMAEGGVSGLIIVAPDASNRFGGAFYSSSETTGDWEGFIADDLVAFIDSRYRTLAQRSSRGLAGHSMGGYGALRIAGRHPDSFGSVYALSPCGVDAGPYRAICENREYAAEVAEAIAKDADPADASVVVRTVLALAAAWSPAKDYGQGLFRLPFGPDGPDFNVSNLWASNTLIEMLDGQTLLLDGFRGIGVEVGDREEYASVAAGAVNLKDHLVKLGIPHEFSFFEGGHADRLAERLGDVVLPFFERHLARV